LAAMIKAAGIEILPITEEIGHLAIDAFDRYGKGRGHPAQLNMGDCFAYACAKAHGLRLLYKGADFSRTDLA
jgi:ribonuclease VapC